MVFPKEVIFKTILQGTEILPIAFCNSSLPCYSRVLSINEILNVSITI